MEIIPFKKIDSDTWDDFCHTSDSAWFRHTTVWIDFCLSLNSKNSNLSFGVYEEDKILAVVPLIKQPIEGEEDMYEFIMGGTPIPYPAFVNGLPDTKKAEIIKFIFENIDQLAKENSVVYSRFFVDPLSRSSLNGGHTYNPFLSLGFSDVSLTTNIIDLSMSEEVLFKNFRHGYRYDIGVASKKGYSVLFFDKDSITDELFKTYKEIYFSAAGREVGTPDRWERTYEIIKKGDAILALERDVNGKFISGVIVFTYKRQAYYAFGATESESKGLNGIGHVLQWEILKHLKAYGFSHYELGWNFSKTISDDVYSPKELGISHFKSGFGGAVLPLWKGEKFYDDAYQIRRRAYLVEKLASYAGH